MPSRKQAIEEHSLAKNVIAELKALAPEAEEYDAKFKVLTDSVQHHIAEEEGEMFPYVERTVDETELQDLGRRMADRKQALMGPSLIGETLHQAKNFVAQAFDAITGNGPAKKPARRRSKKHVPSHQLQARVTPKRRTRKVGRTKVTSVAKSTRTARAAGKAKRILKKAGRKTSPRTAARELRLGNGGISIGAPLTQFRGVLTGVPVLQNE